MTDTDIDDQELIEALPHDDDKWAVFEEVLGEMTPIYHEDAEWLDIVRANISHAKPGGEEIGVQPDLPQEMAPEVSGPDVLRLLDDLCAHEVEHVNASDLDAKAEFAEQYPNFGKMAGHVYNIFEDEYIDMRRKRRFYGMRSKLAYYVWLHMNTPSRAPPVDMVAEEEGLPNALMSGLLQVALAGYMNGEPSDTVKDAMARIEPLIDQVRECDSVHRREVLCHGAIQILLRYIPDPEEYDGDDVDDRKRATGGDPREAEDESPEDGGDPRVEMSDEMEAEVEEMLEELTEDDEVPDPLPGGEPPEVKQPDDIDTEPPKESDLDEADEMDESEPEFDESDIEDAVDDAKDLSDELDDDPEPEGDMPDMGSDSSEDGSGESGEAEDGESESSERDPDVDDETIDPLGEGDDPDTPDDGSDPSPADSGEGDEAGDSEDDGEGFDGYDRDVAELVEKYGEDALTVTD